MYRHNSPGYHRLEGSILQRSLEARPTRTILARRSSQQILAGVLTVPVCGSQSRPPLQPPVAHEFGPGFTLKSQLRRPQIRPAFQLSGTVKLTAVYAPASQLHDGSPLTFLRRLRVLRNVPSCLIRDVRSHVEIGEKLS